MTTVNQYALFKRFQSVEIAKDFAAILKENDIDYQLVDNSPPVDITFSAGTLQNEVQVLVRQSDFERANQLLENQAENLLDQVDKDHYLFGFTIEELYEVILKPDEWSSLDDKLSQKILSDRGQPVDEDLLKKIRKQRIDDLAKPEPPQTAWIYVGYFFAVMGGILGFFIGWFLWSHKKTLPNGQRILAYSRADQRHGRIIFYLGIPFFIFWSFVQYYLESLK